MKRLLIILLLSLSSFSDTQKKEQPQFIEFKEEVVHPELELASHVPLYISTMELNLPLPDAYAKIIEHEKKIKPKMSAGDINKMKELYLRSTYLNLIIDRKLFDLLHNYIIRNSNFLVIKTTKPGCLIVIDNKRFYLPQSNMKEFYRGLKVKLLSKKCDTSMLSKIRNQFTIHVE